MIFILPGTTIEAKLERGVSDVILGNIFMTGGLMMSQVSQLTGLEPYIIQNWVKRGYLSSPVNKLYSRRQFCRILTINMLKESLQLETISKLLSYINGVLSDESDDIIDDSKLYDMYIDVLAELGGRVDDASLEKAISGVLVDYVEPYVGAKKRLSKVLKTMFLANKAVELKKQAEMILAELG